MSSPHPSPSSNALIACCHKHNAANAAFKAASRMRKRWHVAKPTSTAALGGDAGARALAHLLGLPPRPYDRNRGTQQQPQVAWIVEADCIGCTKCIQACPVDAIIGGAKHMHTVIAALCTGCELCVPACPVDCIELHPS